MLNIVNIDKFDFEAVPIDTFWNTGANRESRMHRIHAYPAKFPAFITTKALAFANEIDVKVDSIADIFCGCGTTALEAKRNDINFWGCDINPVATMIAKVKSRKYQIRRLNSYFESIINLYKSTKPLSEFLNANERLKYWYKPTQYNELRHLKNAILQCTPSASDYQQFFLCAFSNILKPTSMWLTKSIKPQIDPNKKPAKVIDSFQAQYSYMVAANDEIQDLGSSDSKIVTGNVLDSTELPVNVDMIITSPPYVTSYEYADLHQLSSLWLDYAEDFRDLRSGSIGSLHHDFNYVKEWKRLNTTGSKIVSHLIDQHKAKARSVAKYFLDMQTIAVKGYEMLSRSGIAVFVIGNTEYKGVRIDNAKHLSESLFNAGFTSVSATKRKISNKILTPYRNAQGKFSSDSRGRKIYSEEFIIIARK